MIYIYCKSMTLKMRSRSPKPNQLLSLSQWYIYASLEKIHPLFKRYSPYKALTLKMRSRSPVTKHISMSPLYTCKFEENPSTGLKAILPTSQWPWKCGQGQQNLLSSSACHNDISMQVWRKSIHWFERYSTYKTMTLKMRSRSPETKHIISNSQWYTCKFEENPSTG